MSHLEQAIELKAQLDALRPPDSEQEKRIWQKFRFDWNYHSNNIEGNSLTFGETKSLLLHNITAQGKPLKDHIEITGHNEAINALVDLTRGDTPLTESFVRQLHTLILRERYQVDAITPEGAPTRRWIEVGQYKTGQNHVQTVTGEIFRFAEPMDVPGKMHALLQTINELQTPSSAEVVLVAAKAHYDFVLIHPFDDGNGRMARLLMNLILIKHGFPPAIIKTEDKANYLSALRQADGGQLEMFVEYIARCVRASLQIMLAGAKGESIEEPDEESRQIKMLARLVEGKSDKLLLTKTDASVKRVYDASFEPIALRLAAAAEKFSSMYVSRRTEFYVDNLGVAGDNFESLLVNGRRLLKHTSIGFRIHLLFDSLRFQGLDRYSHVWSFHIELHLGSYEFTGTSIGSSPLTRKRYDQHIDAQETESIASGVVREHICAIEQAAGVSLGELSAT